jgi:hypothetical protein
MKRTLIIGGSILVGAVGLFFIGKAIINKVQQKKAQERDALRKQSSQGGGASVGNEPVNKGESADKYNPSSDLKALAGYIIGANFFYYPKEIGDIVFKLNDAEVKKLNTAWKKKYKESLYQSLAGEYHTGYYDGIMGRLKSLGLT